MPRSKRELINTSRDKRYMRRDSGGQFSESDDVGRSLTQDRPAQSQDQDEEGAGRPRGSVKIVEQQLQVLDVGVVDVLSHLEALLRHSHSIQRALLQLRSEAPPPPTQVDERVMATLTAHAQDLRREWTMLGEIVSDLETGIHRLSGAENFSDRRSGRDRRTVLA